MNENPAKQVCLPESGLINKGVFSCYSGLVPICSGVSRAVRLLSGLWGATKNKGAENQPLVFDLVGMTRLELATSRPPDACANQLRYIPSSAIAFLYCGCKITYNL